MPEKRTQDLSNSSTQKRAKVDENEESLASSESALQSEENATVTVTTGKKAFVLSLIRHGQSVNQVTGSGWPHDGDLSPKGEEQVELLGKMFESTTSLAISTQNKGQPQVIQDKRFVEREGGKDFLELCRINDLEGARRCFQGPDEFNRNYQPPGGGESMNMVSARARSGLVELMKRHGKDMEIPPDLPGLWGPGLEVRHSRHHKMITTLPETLPDGIPHVVLVGHNAFLTMLYEEMYSWDTQWRVTECGYQNTSWSRHVVWLDIEADKLKFLDLQESWVETCCIQ